MTRIVGLVVLLAALPSLAESPPRTFLKHENLRCKKPVGATLRGDPVIVTTKDPVTVERVEDFVIQTSQGPLPFWRTRKSNSFTGHDGYLLPYPLGYWLPRDLAGQWSGKQYALWLHNFYSYVEVPSDVNRAQFSLRVLTRFGAIEEFQYVADGDWALPRHPANAARLLYKDKNEAHYYDSDGTRYEYGPGAPVLERSAGGIEQFRALMLVRAVARDERELFRLEYGVPGSTSECGAWVAEGEPYLKRIVPPGGPAIELMYQGVFPRPACENGPGPGGQCPECTGSPDYQNCAPIKCNAGDNELQKCACVLASARLENSSSYLATWQAEARWFEDTPVMYPCNPYCSTYYSPQ